MFGMFFTVKNIMVVRSERRNSHVQVLLGMLTEYVSLGYMVLNEELSAIDSQG